MNGTVGFGDLTLGVLNSFWEIYLNFLSSPDVQMAQVIEIFLLDTQ